MTNKFKLQTAIIGYGGLAREIAAYNGKHTVFDPYNIGFFVEDSFYQRGVEHLYPLSCIHEMFEEHKEEEPSSLIAIGDPYLKERIFTEYNIPNIKSAFIASGVLYLSDYTRCNGIIVCPGAIVTTNVTLGKCVLVNINATVGHDTVIGDFTTVSPGANISGNVRIGAKCYIGTGAAIIEKISICDNVTIGAGAVVAKNIEEPGTYVGIPAKKIK